MHLFVSLFVSLLQGKVLVSVSRILATRFPLLVVILKLSAKNARLLARLIKLRLSSICAKVVRAWLACTQRLLKALIWMPQSES